MQDYAQSMGFGVDAQGNLTNQANLAGRAQNETEAARLAANQLAGRSQTETEAARKQADLDRMTALLGYRIDPNTGQPIMSSQTLESRRLAQEGETAKAQRELQERMQGAGFGQQTSERLGTQQFQAGESAYERQLRQTMQAAEFGQQTSERLGTQTFQAGESLAERNARLALQVGQQQWQSGESAQERDLRERLQAGQLNQQESEFARTYILQQQESRRQEAALTGQLEGGGLTEAARAARAQETSQRAQLAAQLLGTPKDAFKAGAFFRTLKEGDQANMGFGGGGISGFNSFDSRIQGTGGTLTPGDVYGAVGGDGAPGFGGMAQSAQLSAPQAQATTPGVPAVPNNTSGANSPASTGLSDLWGGGGGSAADVSNAVDSTMSGSDDDNAGDEPGGPVGNDAASMVRPDWATWG